jgi:hypothetical protein
MDVAVELDFAYEQRKWKQRGGGKEEESAFRLSTSAKPAQHSSFHSFEPRE